MARQRRKTDVEKLKEFDTDLQRLWERCRAAWREDQQGWMDPRYNHDQELNGMYPDGNNPFFEIGYLVQGFRDWRADTGERVLSTIAQHDAPLVQGIEATCVLVWDGWSAMGKEFAKGQAPEQDVLI